MRQFQTGQRIPSDNAAVLSIVFVKNVSGSFRIHCVKKAAVTFLCAAAPLICGIRVLQVQFFSYGTAVRYAISPLLSFLDLPANAFFGTVTSR